MNDILDTLDYLRDGNSKVMHMSNYIYAIDLSESHLVAYHSPHDPLRVYEAKVLCCRSLIAEVDRKFYISESRVRMLKIPDVMRYWGYMSLPWVDDKFAKYIKVHEDKDKLFVFLSHIDYDTL